MYRTRGQYASGTARGNSGKARVRRFECAQSQFGCQIVHRYFTGSILATKASFLTAVIQLLLSCLENNKAPPASQIASPLLCAPALETVKSESCWINDLGMWRRLRSRRGRFVFGVSAFKWLVFGRAMLL
jgi:hypothetical protein